MADQKIPYEFQTDFGQIGELERIAELMQQQRLMNQKNMGGQMVSGHFVRMSPMQGLADMFAAYQGGKARTEAGRLRTELPRRMAAAEQSDVDRVEALRSGVRPQTGDSAYDDVQRAGNPMAAEQAGFSSQWPRAQALADRLMKERQSSLGLGAKGATNESVVRAAQSGNPRDLMPDNAAAGSPQMIPGSDKRPDPNRPGQFLPPIFGFQDKNGSWHELGADRAAKVSVSVGKDAEDPYLREAQTGMAKGDVGLYQAAQGAHMGNQALTRIENIIKQNPPSGGPLAFAEVWIRNLAAQYGVPLNEAVDTSNAKLTAEFTSRIADQVLTGGRGISNDDAKRLEASFPSFRSGIPTQQLPAFVAQLKMINNARISGWNEVYGAMDPKRKAQYPLTFGPQRDVSASGGRTPAFADPEKERRYQEWKRAQQMGGSPVRGGQ